jgi:hypothetical protein
MNNQGPVPQPDLRAILDQEQDNTFSSFNCVQVGVINTFDTSKQSATITLVNARAVYNTVQGSPAGANAPQIFQYPLLVDVPVFVLNGGGAVMTMPIKGGEPCIVLFNDRDLDPWWSNGTQGAPPNSLRMHSLADGMALVGIRAKLQAFAGYSATDVEIKLAGGELAVTGAGDAKAESVHGGKVEVQAKLGLSNNATSLLAVLSNLVSTLQEWVDTNGDTPDGATLAALASNLSQIQSLLQ